jgi:hypothetical protein
MAPTRRRFAAVCALLALAGGCARNPVTGRPQVTLVSEAEERELGLVGQGDDPDAALRDF